MYIYIYISKCITVYTYIYICICLSFNQDSQKMIPSPIIQIPASQPPETMVHFPGSVDKCRGASARDGQSQHHETRETAPGAADM